MNVVRPALRPEESLLDMSGAAHAVRGDGGVDARKREPAVFGIKTEPNSASPLKDEICTEERRQAVEDATQNCGWLGGLFGGDCE